MQSNCKIQADGLSLNRCEACSPYRILFNTEEADERENPASATFEASGLAGKSIDGVRTAKHFTEGAIQARQKPAIDAVPDATALIVVAGFMAWLAVRVVGGGV